MTAATSGSGRSFDSSFRDEHVLSDGARIFLKTLQPEDKDGLLSGFQRMSEASRYSRFFSHKGSLTGRELRYFTETDGENPFALAAGCWLSDGQEEGIGTARFVRLVDDPGAAEPAVTIVDEWQGRGVGRILFDHLVAAAKERDVERFECTVMAENKAMLRLLRSYPGESSKWDGDAIHVTLDLT